MSSASTNIISLPGSPLFCRVALVAAVLLVAACSKEGSGSSVEAPAATVGNSPQQPVDNGLVAAVALEGSGAAATLRFEVLERPQPGSPFNLRLQLQPLQTLTLLQADLVDTEGVRRLSAPNLLRLVGAAAAGLPERTVAMQVDHAGIYEIKIAVKTESTAGAGVAQFVLPVLVEAAPPAP